MNINETVTMKKITFYFTILCALFLMLSSQFTGFILPLLFILPIFMGLIGMKRRRKSGYLIAMAIVPLAFAISVLWIRYSIRVFSDRANQIAQMSAQYNISTTKAGAFTLIFFLLSVLMISLSVIVFVKLRRHKELFT
ncbi:hypothetical protein LGL55_10935 [Clostridium tagluense]|uniref:hypothetical protein n=1 Tax=Clostridium tagluense TaxID=360422 RepID=UPI001CF49594|nr:hypothetical protein [Clostridium tagluense]MCB2311767.1 hypothetical protein [Clostridium tagluense]MCB2316511.1 hypothetical protein [Clostridium tagluense]MCB2321347.1 hypothetical protein [Clostridium tagluense]MCB2326380.1 hypothetical protein [Clostridium tagluense]MCB2331103.1 hypothetical protein [Clostridium tagluense]